MQVRPVGCYPEPGYPTRLEVLAHPDLLRRNLPAAWRRIPGIATAVACFLSAEGTLLAGDAGTSAVDEKPAQAASRLVVAPLFRHGEGCGSMPCVAVNPPVFLSEHEALRIIEQELSLHGVRLGTPAEEWKTVRAPDPDLDDEAATNRAKAQPLRADGYDFDRGIAFEYVDADEGSGSEDSYSAYFAEYRRTQLTPLMRAEGPDTYYGVFYDPLESTFETGETCLTVRFDRKAHEPFNAPRELALARAREHLRQQVADFAEWLKGQGVL